MSFGLAVARHFQHCRWGLPENSILIKFHETGNGLSNFSMQHFSRRSGSILAISYQWICYSSVRARAASSTTPALSCDQRNKRVKRSPNNSHNICLLKAKIGGDTTMPPE
jgi:hypothetical protein